MMMTGHRTGRVASIGPLKRKKNIDYIRLIRVAMRLIGVLCPSHFITETLPDRRNPITFSKSADKITDNTAHKIPDKKLTFGQCYKYNLIILKIKLK